MLLTIFKTRNQIYKYHVVIRQWNTIWKQPVANTCVSRRQISNDAISVNIKQSDTPKGNDVTRCEPLDTGDFKLAFKHRRVSEIARSLIVFKICSFQFVVKRSMKLMQFGRSVLGRRLFNRLMKATFYRQFVAGETVQELRTAVGTLQKDGMGPMLCVPIEEDAGNIDSISEKYNKNLAIITECIRLSKSVDPNYPMSQIKLTALVPGELCAVISKHIADPLAHPDSIEAICRRLDGGTLVLDCLEEQELRLLDQALDRLKVIGELSVSEGVRLWIDAEYTYMNPALRLLSICMMLTYNKHQPLMAYTYQNYLKETFDILKSDVEFTRSKGVCFGAKLVRGAYMDKERQLAREGVYEDPVHESFERTSAMYHASMEYLLDRIHDDLDKYLLVIASHNEATVQRAVQYMNIKQITPNNGAVFFGQLYGMADHISSALGNAGYSVYKSTPYGLVEETLPYLHRRALENSSLLGTTHRERQLLWRCLVHRMSRGCWPRTSGVKL